MKIVSDGTNQGTRIYTDEGEDITKEMEAADISIYFDPHELPKVKITCLQRPLVLEIDDDQVDYDLTEPL